jgi:ABC-type branched-subunit amino acid transport system substrate-binding protein
MTVTTLNSAGPTYKNIANTAQAYEKYINTRGGIAGHPLKVTVCDEQFDPAVAATCARQAVDGKMVSVVGSFTFLAESIVPVIAKANITWFGECCPITPSELTDPHSFPIGNQPMYAVGAIKRAVADGCKNINAVIIDGAQVFQPPMENAIKALGKSFGTLSSCRQRQRTTRPKSRKQPRMPTASSASFPRRRSSRGTRHGHSRAQRLASTARRAT